MRVAPRGASAFRPDIMRGRLGLPQPARLRTARDFDRVFRNRQKIDNPLFVIHHAPSDQARLGLVVSRRVARQAVSRNRIRRGIRETFRMHRHRLPPRDYIVQARQAAAQSGAKEMRAALDQLWDRMIDS